MLVAVVTRAPVIDGRVRSVDAKAALAIPGVRDVLQIPPRPDVLGGNRPASRCSRTTTGPRIKGRPR